jgi:tetratricopeptide (TPR) repeat protein
MTKVRSTTTSRICSSSRSTLTGSIVERQKSISTRTGTLAITALVTGVFVFVWPLYSQANAGSDAALQPGRQLFAQKRFKEAEDFFEKSLASAEGSGEARVCLAQVYNEEGRYTKASALCDQVLSLNDRDVDALVCRAEAYLKMNQLPKAQADCHRALEINPNHAQSYCIRAQVQAQLERYKEALNDADRAIVLAPNSAEALCTRAQICLKLEQYERAVDDADKAIKLDDKLAGAYYYRGRSYKELGRKTLARHDLQTAKTLGFQE